ncbi:MAG: hypothetical protein ABFS35_23620 [Bacteroidota bacterium]
MKKFPLFLLLLVLIITLIYFSTRSVTLINHSVSPIGHLLMNLYHGNLTSERLIFSDNNISLKINKLDWFYRIKEHPYNMRILLTGDVIGISGSKYKWREVDISIEKEPFSKQELLELESSLAKFCEKIEGSDLIYQQKHAYTISCNSSKSYIIFAIPSNGVLIKYHPYNQEDENEMIRFVENIDLQIH